MRKSVTILSILSFFQVTFWISDLVYAADSISNFHVSIQKAVFSGGGIQQLGLAYNIEPQWSIGVHGNTGSSNNKSKYGVDRVTGFGAGLSAAYYRSGYGLESILSKGRIGMQFLDLSQKGFKVDDKDRLGVKQLDVDFLGGYQFVWNREFVLDITAGLRKSFLDVSHKEYVFSDKAYNLKVLHADEVEKIHLLVELGFGVLI